MRKENYLRGLDGEKSAQTLDLKVNKNRSFTHMNIEQRRNWALCVMNESMEMNARKATRIVY